MSNVQCKLLEQNVYEEGITCILFDKQYHQLIASTMKGLILYIDIDTFKIKKTIDACSPKKISKILFLRKTLSLLYRYLVYSKIIKNTIFLQNRLGFEKFCFL